MASHLLPRRKYVAAIFSSETQMRLRRWAAQNGFDLNVSFKGGPKDDWEFHSTIMYSETEHMTPVLGVRSLPVRVKVTPTGFKLLGEDQDIPVLTIKDTPLKHFRDLYKRLYGMEDKWPDWQPHVSLSYLRKKYDFTDMKLPDFDLFVDHIKVENVID